MAGEWHFAQAENSASGSGSDFAKKHYGDAAAAYRSGTASASVEARRHGAELAAAAPAAPASSCHGG
jgi:hypothetical protein